MKKNLLRFVSVALVLVMMMGMNTVAFAADPDPDVDAGYGEEGTFGDEPVEDDDTIITFVAGDSYTLEAQKGTYKSKRGDVTVEISGDRVDEKYVPGVESADKFYDVIGWAVKDRKTDKLELIDITKHKFNSDTKVYAVTKDSWPMFNDMKPDRSDWFYKELRDLSIEGIVGGYADGGYHAENKVTWGAALKLIMLAAGYEEQPQIPGTNHACSGYLEMARIKGLVDVDAKIDLYQPITRLEFAQVTAKALEMPEAKIDNPFTDTEDPSVIALNEAGIINGYGDGRFGPDDGIKRSHIAAIIWRVNNYLA